MTFHKGAAVSARVSGQVTHTVNVPKSVGAEVARTLASKWATHLAVSNSGKSWARRWLRLHRSGAYRL